MRKWYPAFLIVVASIASAVAYPRLPDNVPVHWDLHGHVNGWQSRGRAVVFLPVLLLVIWGLMRVLPATVMIVGAFVSETVGPIVIVCVVASVVGSMIYSYVAWRQETSR